MNEAAHLHPGPGQLWQLHGGQYYRVQAKRKITTEEGAIEAGAVGFVPAGWVEKIKAGQCACKGSLNWFKFV